VVVGDGELGGFVDLAPVFGAGGLEDGDDALHPFDEFADLGGGHAFAGGHLAEAEFGGLASVEGGEIQRAQLGNFSERRHCSGYRDPFALSMWSWGTWRRSDTIVAGRCRVRIVAPGSMSRQLVAARGLGASDPLDGQCQLHRFGCWPLPVGSDEEVCVGAGRGRDHQRIGQLQ